VIVVATIAAMSCRRTDSDPATAVASGVDPAHRPVEQPVAHEVKRPQRHVAPATPASGSAFYAATFERRPSATELSALGALAFADPGLSASGKLACATCHDPGTAYAPANARAVQLGGAGGKLSGFRATPSLRYLQNVPRFTEHFHDSDDRDDVDQGLAGGYTWDGRAQSRHEQALAPLTSPVEMANATLGDVAAALRRAPYADRFRVAFGAHALDAEADAVKALTLALEVYQQDPERFYPYTSKYDAVIRGKASLTAQEERGRRIFDDPQRGNCASCHPDVVAGGFPAFTDFGFVALGVPRNRDLPANADPAFFDLGLCGPLRADLASRDELCGKFRTPSLRNVARRSRFFHNGAIARLDEAVRFYATRDTAPERWYRGGQRFDDLPAKYRGNVSMEVPFGGKPGDRPRLDDAAIADVVAFLGTLSDGWTP
jgi:cytochrome c peroxidase